MLTLVLPTFTTIIAKAQRIGYSVNLEFGIVVVKAGSSDYIYL